MMFGTRATFGYVECASCGCVQIKDYPENLTKHYPEKYYSYIHAGETQGSIVKRYFRKRRARYNIFGKSLIGALVARVKPPPPMFELLRVCGARLTSRILELGSGSGGFLIALRNLGFRDLTGFDPFVRETQEIASGIEVLKGDIEDLEGPYDLIIARDTIEHMPQQHEVFRHIARLLAQDGAVLISLPVIGYAWRFYGTDWVGLDAPRHHYLHTIKSLGLLCQDAGLHIFHSTFDSNEDQFIGSEQYKRDIPLLDDRSYYRNQKASVFSEADIEMFRNKAAQLNADRDGDRISLCLRK